MRSSGLYASLLLVTFAFCFAAEQPALKDVFADQFLIGAAVNDHQMQGRAPEETALVVRQFNTITPENVLKWEAVHPQPDKYDFAAADRFVEFGEKNDMFIVGHTLVWHSQTPRWVFEDADGKPLTRDALLARLKDHIATIMGRYKGRIGGWDVVNEAVEDDGSLRKTKWLDGIGDDYIAKAFEFARQADPDAKLYYNDYNMYKLEHAKGVAKLIRSLQEKGIRVDGIGIQGHWGLDYPSMDELNAALAVFAELKVPLMITEMDITVLPSASRNRGADISQSAELRKELNPYSDGLPEEMQQKLAARYGELFKVLVQHADLFERVTFWGVQDGNSWRNNWPVRGRTDYPLLFDRQCKPKPAFDAVVKAAQERK
ncbi:MAG: endo-1,4-beta-xylanase [Planctomycetaceae bacterium]|nr:endo-1,4-beta-xylanase [Planctomycetaceae bacterium]